MNIFTDNDNFFGGIFDFNRDGETTFVEKMIGFVMMQELFDDEEDSEDFDDFDDYDDSDSL